MLIGIFVLCIYVPQALAQTTAGDIQKAETYLKNLDTVKADFIQTDHYGSRLSGTFYLNRPGAPSYDTNYRALPGQQAMYKLSPHTNTATHVGKDCGTRRCTTSYR